MARTARNIKPLRTIWELSDDLWALIEPILLDDAPPTPRSHGGRPRIDWRRAIDGIIFRLRSGCQWNKLPEHFGNNWDALADCLEDGDWLGGHGIAIVVRHAKPYAKTYHADWETLSDILGEAAEYWQERHKPFWVFVG